MSYILDVHITETNACCLYELCVCVCVFRLHCDLQCDTYANFNKIFSLTQIFITPSRDIEMLVLWIRSAYFIKICDSLLWGNEYTGLFPCATNIYSYLLRQRLENLYKMFNTFTACKRQEKMFKNFVITFISWISLSMTCPLLN